MSDRIQIAATQPPIAYEDAPFTSFHLRVIIAALAGQASDGFEIGVIGISLHTATDYFTLTPLWLGLLGGASLMGLFFGALLTGPLADWKGRKPIFGWNMALIAFFSFLQFFVTSPSQLFVLRLIIGFLLGSDYVVGKSLLMEFSPRKVRGRVVSVLAIAWALGYVLAYIVGFALADIGPDAWRWILVAGVVPALISVPLRITIPESPAWLISRGQRARALAIVRRHLGPNIDLPEDPPVTKQASWRLKELFLPAWRRRTVVGATFFTCQVIPYFALGTFVAPVMAELRVSDANYGGLIYNAFLLFGAILGWVIVDYMPRRVLLVGSFTLAGAALLPLVLWTSPPGAVVITLFAIEAATLSAASTLCYVYLTELFPTDLRASGVGVSVAASRLGSAVSTFLLPLIVASYGIRTALGLCVFTVAFGAVLCFAWAPETRNLSLRKIATAR